ncbi:MAG: hypothetical protein KJ607_09000, partial [Bacteroidetes bacterium]|nr:hypothetical protein [Bacteroidota bacterium]
MKYYKAYVFPLLAVILSSPMLSGQNVYYVRTNGSDANTGLGPDAGQAWQTISYAASQMNIPGDIVYVAPGIYLNEGNEVEITNSGTSGDEIQYIADTDGSEFSDISAGSVIIECGGVNDGFILTAVSYIVIDGFTINNSDGDGVYFDTDYSGNCDYNEIKNCIIESPGSNGVNLQATSTDPNYYLCNYNLIHNNCILNAGDDGIYVGDGYDGFVGAVYWCAYNEFYNNTINCGRYGIYGSYGIDHTYIYNNRISTNDGTGIYLPGAHKKLYTIIYNNMIYDSEYGIECDDPYCNYSKILYNSFYTSSTCVYWKFGETGDGDLVEIQNNIFYTTSTSSTDYCLFIWDDIDMETPTIDNNHYYRPDPLDIYAAYTTVYKYDLSEFADWQSGVDWGGPGFDNNSTWGTDPEFTSATDLHLSATSPCRNQGASIVGYTSDLDGEARDGTPDIGADEYSATPSPDDCLCASLNIDSENSTDITCNNDNDGTITITASGGTAPLEYSVDGGSSYQGTGNFINLTPGSYTIVIRDANGCTKTGSTIVIAEPSAISPAATPADAQCNGGADGTVTLVVSGGTSPYTFLWSNSATTQNISGLTADTYTVTVTDSHSCTATTSAVVGEPFTISPAATPADAQCNGGADGTVTLVVSGGTSPYTFLWSNSATTQNISGLTANTYTVTVTDSHSCTATTSAVVGEPFTISPAATPADAQCNGGADGTVTLVVSGGTSPYTFLWSNSATT